MQAAPVKRIPKVLDSHALPRRVAVGNLRDTGPKSAKSRALWKRLQGVVPVEMDDNHRPVAAMFCATCARTVYTGGGDDLACPVCSSPLLQQVSPPGNGDPRVEEA